MIWYLNAVIAAIGFTAQFLGMKRLQKTYPIPVYMAYVWLGSSVILGILFVRPTTSLTIANGILLIVAAFASWAGMYVYNLAIKQQPNIGYVEALSSIRVAIVYCVSLWFFDATFELSKLLAVIGIVTGVLLLTGFRSLGRQTSGKTWILWGFLSGVMFALLVVCVKVVTMRGLDARASTAILLFFSGVIFVVSAIGSGKSLRPSGDLPVISLVIAVSSLGNAALFMSYSDAPNLAYPTAISNSRMILLYIVALVTKSDKLELSKAFGIILAFTGVALLS